MAGPEDHDFDDNGNLRDISESWSSYEDECRKVAESDDDYDTN